MSRFSLSRSGVLIAAMTGKLPLEGLIFSPLGAFGVFVFLFAFTFMALAQLRHAVWNSGKHLDPDKNNFWSFIMLGIAIGFSFVMTLGIAGVFS